MTGFGESHEQDQGLSVAVEVRTVNNRYFKLSLKCPEAFGALEGEIETVARQLIKRGTVQIALRVDRARAAEDYRLNLTALASYREQLQQALSKWHLADNVAVDALLALPGVVEETTLRTADAAQHWPLIRRTLEQALSNLARMRGEEGKAMAIDLRENCRAIAGELAAVETRAPLVVDGYRNRLEERLKKALAEYQVTLDPADVIREVSLFADRSDVSEECVRLRSHLEQFETFLQESDSAGRKLDFLTQEMFRETNTIGSKANDVQIARHVIEMKAAIERIREMIQNVE